MASFSISEVEELTGIKAHVLRYWEDVVPSFKPQKDDGGRRFYTQREVDLIFRLKYLIYEKKFTAEGAGQQIMEEAGVAQDNFELIKLKVKMYHHNLLQKKTQKPLLKSI